MDPRSPSIDGGLEDSAAVNDALRFLARRPRTQTEIARRLEELGHPQATVEAVVERLRARGYVDDSDLAFDFIVARAERLGHGPGRLIGDLVRRGVSPEVAGAAWRLAVEREAIVPGRLLRRQIRRRLSRVARPDRKTQARVYNALLRAGFDGDLVRRELETYCVTSGPSGESAGDGMNDDLP